MMNKQTDKRKAPAVYVCRREIIISYFCRQKSARTVGVNIISKNVNLIRKYTVNDISTRIKNCQPFLGKDKETNLFNQCIMHNS